MSKLVRGGIVIKQVSERLTDMMAELNEIAKRRDREAFEVKQREFNALYRQASEEQQGEYHALWCQRRDAPKED